MIFTDWYLPGYKAGGPIKSIASMVKLLQDEFNFYIVTSNTDFGENKPYSDVKSNTWVKLKSNENVFYFSKNYLSKSKIKEIIEQNKPDLIYCNSLFSLYFSIVPVVLLKLGKLPCALLLAPRGMLGEGALQIKSVKKKIFLNVFKFLNVPKSVFWHSTSLQEANEIKNNFGEKVSVITVGNMQILNSDNASNIIEKKVNEVRWLFLSRISEKKNLLFALNVLNQIPISDKSLCFDIVGPIEDTVYWKKCQDAINNLNEKGIKVNYLGSVSSELVKATIEKYHFLFLPTLNENYGHVIVESLFAARPVLISDNTPWRGLKINNAGWDINLNDKDAFKNAILESLEMNNVDFQEMSNSAYTYAKENCKFDEDKEKTINMFYSVMN